MEQIDIGGELRNLIVERKRNKKMYLRVKEDGTLYVTCTLCQGAGNPILHP